MVYVIYYIYIYYIYISDQKVVDIYIFQLNPANLPQKSTIEVYQGPSLVFVQLVETNPTFTSLFWSCIPLSLFTGLYTSKRWSFGNLKKPTRLYMGGNPKIGLPTPKWMVKIMENPIKMDDLEENPLFFETSICGYIHKHGGNRLAAGRTFSCWIRRLNSQPHPYISKRTDGQMDVPLEFRING